MNSCACERGGGTITAACVMHHAWAKQYRAPRRERMADFFRRLRYGRP